ncbi:transcriptional regulator Spx [Salicibibacter cibarius]|uniref:Transcriptional regulator Spx n=1 Tax=Salicibibacter cibarius TaxID=2743000 RepID=A0A7T7CA31_9BACI|nr:transcriptional regulator Spx [Salicibibacter cibarius]QQK74433.1 transcriptional regulator Spx [Salicibibacter cibarius]
MVQLLTSTGSTSCRLARSWLEKHHIPFNERNIFAEPLSVEEVKFIMHMTENGTDEIISKRSKAFQDLNVDVDEMSLHHFFQLVSQHPGLLRKPIIFDHKRLQVGYQEEDMRRFLPRQIRSYRLQEARMKELLGNTK